DAAWALSGDNPATAARVARAAAWAAARTRGVTSIARAVAWATGSAANCPCDFLRDIFGVLPFRPLTPVTPVETAWDAGLARRVAEAAYVERSLPCGLLDPARLSILADALEDAGCTDAPLLEHLRSGGVHVRGCWAVDLLLGRG